MSVNYLHYFVLKAKSIFLVFVIFLFSNYYLAQSIHFDFKNGTNTAYNLTDIRKITFEGDLMNLHLLDGSVYSWNVSTIGQYEYSTSSVNIQEIVNKINFFQVSIFPNPIDNSLQLLFNLPKEDNIDIVICDLQGKLILEKKIGYQLVGEHHEVLNLDNLSKGVYMCLIKGKQNSISKKIIKN